jgi:lipoprotein-anchoring transpeptidase ErfK/SrfK
MLPDSRHAGTIDLNLVSQMERSQAMPRTAKRKSAGSVILSLAAGMLVLVLLVAGALTALYFSDFTVPGVQAMGLDLGGRTTLQAGEALLNQWQAKTIQVTAGQQSWDVPPNSLGLVLDVDATAQQAYQQGRSFDSLGRWWQSGGRSVVTPVWHFDPVVAETTLRMLATEVQVPAKNPSLRIVNGQIQQVSGAPGQALDVQATLDWLSANTADVLSRQRLEGRVLPVAPAIADLSPAVTQAEKWLSASRSVYLYDPLADQSFTWQITPEQIGSWLTLHLNPEDAAYLTWTFDEPAVQAYLQGQQTAQLGEGRFVKMDEALPAVLKEIREGAPDVHLRVYHHDRKYVVKPGETFSSIADQVGMPYPWIQAANPGIGEMLRSGQEITIPSQDAFLPLPPVQGKRIIVNMATQDVQAIENGQVKWHWKASTGMLSSPTSPGFYQIRTHDPNAYAANWDLWMPYFMGIYQPVPGNDFMNGFHGFPKRGGTQILWQNNLGTRITYGCIMVSTDNAKLLYDWAEEGVVVEIRG